jgi:hypothetical protein
MSDKKEFSCVPCAIFDKDELIQNGGYGHPTKT